MITATFALCVLFAQGQQKTSAADSLKGIVDSDTILSEADKAELYSNLSKSFSNSPEKALTYDYLEMELAKENKWNDNLINATISYANHSNQLCKYGQADTALLQIENLVKSTNGPVKLSDYYYQRAGNYYDWSRYELAKVYFEKALTQYKHHKDKIGIAKTLKGLGVTVSVWSDFQSSISYLQKARDIYSDLDDKKGLASINISLGAVLEQWGKNSGALNHYQDALVYYDENKDLFNQANLRLHIGDLYLKGGNYAKALEYYFTAQNIEKQKPHKKLRAITLSNIGEAYYFMGRYQDALDYQKKAILIKKEIGDRKRIAISYIDMGKIYLAQNNYDKAIVYARKAYNASKKSKLNYETQESLHLLSEALHNSNQPDSAYIYLNKYIKIKDKIYNQENTRTLNNLSIKYKVKEKEKENKLLKVQNIKNEISIREERTNKYLTYLIAVFILLFALIIVLFLRVRERQNRKNNLLLQNKNQEITKQKEKLSVLNYELSESRAQYMSIVENATIGMYRTTKDGRVLFANNALLTMIDTTWDDLKEVNLNIVKPDRVELLNLLDEKSVITGREDIWSTKTGDNIFVKESIWTVTNKDGEIQYYEGIVEDITKRKIAEKELIDKEQKLLTINEKLKKNNAEVEKARRELEKAYKTKSEFLANISHEIRTPLNAILGFTDLLMNMVEQPKLQFVLAIRSSGKSLLSLINDILDLSKIQAGKIELHYEPISLQDIIMEVNQVFTLAITEKGLDFNLKTHPSIAKLLFLDGTRMRQILFNLLGNAVKFSEEGFINLTVDVTNETSQKINLTLIVSDSGSGIPKEKQKEVFEAFIQNDGGKHPGTGLGLSITKRLVETMGGTISMTSKLGKGTTFTIVLPDIRIFEGNKPKNTKLSETDNYNHFESKTKLGNTVKFNEQELESIANSDFTILFKKRCLKLQNQHVIKDIINCSEDIISFAGKNNFAQLQKLARELKKASRSFDIEKIEQILELLIKLFF